MTWVDKMMKWMDVQENFIYLMSVVFIVVLWWAGRFNFIVVGICLIISTLFWQMIRHQVMQTKVRAKKREY